MRIGMFVTATFHGLTTEKHATVPATAILHLHDREFVYTPLGNGRFRREEVNAGNMLPENMQEVLSGLKPGDQVVARALVFQNTVEQ
jgi:cobalt-zinc-cadmium efflux system membrane fusion protein